MTTDKGYWCFNCQYVWETGYCPKCTQKAAALNPQQANKNDPINPKHYKSHPSGVECITVIEHMPFNIGTAVKYLWRCGLKNDEIEDLKKAAWYIEREISKREKEKK